MLLLEMETIINDSCSDMRIKLDRCHHHTSCDDKVKKDLGVASIVKLVSGRVQVLRVEQAATKARELLGRSIIKSVEKNMSQKILMLVKCVSDFFIKF